MKYVSMRRVLCALLLAAMLPGSVLAADQNLGWDEVYCFSQADFQAEEISGVMLTGLPGQTLGTLMLGDRQLYAGDVLTAEQLSELTFVPSGSRAGDAVIACLRLTDDGPSAYALTLRIGAKKNEPPTAEDSEFQTYKNIPGEVPLTVCDPENEALTVTIVREPKRGEVQVGEDGTVVYTPKENKVGKDSFTYTVTDPAGGVSEEATVRIEILKPSDKQTYGDLEGDPALLAAVWLREAGIFGGETVSGQLLFSPDQTVSRGEFIAMCAGLVGLDEKAPVSAGFADEEPEWLRPYVTTALRCGYLTGIPTSQGLTLEAGGEITQAQAAKMVSSLLSLGQEDSSSVMALSDGVPAWAAGSASAMAGQSLYTVTEADAALSRREAALLLYRAHLYAEARQEDGSLLAWAADGKTIR